MQKTLSRREVLGMGLFAAAAGAGGVKGSAPSNAPALTAEEKRSMSTIRELNQYGADLEKMLILRSSPIAVKMLEKEADIPKEAIRPKRDRKYHLAQCQAFALSRRDGTTVAMLKEDHWCPTALMAYGMVKRPDSVDKWSHPYECFEVGKYIGIVSAPLNKASFIPDVIIIYARPAQLRGLLLSMKIDEVPQVAGHFFPPSCGWSIVNPMRTDKYWVVIPDPGEYQRALTDEGDLMFSIPQSKIQGMMTGLRKNEHGIFSYREHSMFMQPDFEQPELYKEMFKGWGLDTK